MFRFLVPVFAGVLAASALAGGIQTGSDLAVACRAFAAKDEAYGKTPDGAADPCRKFVVGFLASEKTRQDAELSARTSSPTAPLGPMGCIRMPDKLTYYDFAKRIAGFDDATQSLRNGPALALAQRTLAANFQSRQHVIVLAYCKANH